MCRIEIQILLEIWVRMIYKSTFFLFWSSLSRSRYVMARFRFSLKFKPWWYKNHPVSFFGLVWTDIKTPCPDLDSPRNFMQAHIQWVPATPAKPGWHFNYTYLPNAVTVAETGSNNVTQAVWGLYSWLLCINLMLLLNVRADIWI